MRNRLLRRVSWTLAACFALGAIACGDDDATPTTDAGPGVDGGGSPDTGTGDAGPGDAGSSVFPALGDAIADTLVSNIRVGCCGNEVGIGLNGAGEPRIIGLQDPGQDLWMATFAAGTWTEENVSATPSTDSTAFALGDDDVPHVLVRSVTTARTRSLWYIRRDAGTWSETEVDPASDVDGATHFDIALDSTNTAHVAYRDTATGIVKYGVWNGAGFDLSDVDGPPAMGDQNGEYATIAVAGDGTVHISFLAVVGGTPVLRHASGTSAAWTAEDVPGEGKGVYGAIMVDAAGHPHIVSTGLVGSRARGVYWSAFDGSTWTEVPVDSNPDMAVVALDAVLDSGDRPHVMISESIAFGLGPWKYYRWDGGAFEMFARPITGSMQGPFPESVSIAVDDSLMPHMATPGFYYHY